MSEIIGHVDARDRPIVALSLPGHDDDLLFIIDTGFNGQLLVHDVDNARLKFKSMRVDVPVEFADRSSRLLEVAAGCVVWFGQERNVDVWIATAEAPRFALPDEPVGLLGTGLLTPHKLTVDFATRRVIISENSE